MSTKGKDSNVEDIPDIRRKQITLNVACGDCIFHKKVATYKKPCYMLGTPSSAQVCARFIPDPYLIGEEFSDVLRLVSNISKPQVIAAAMVSAKKVARSGFNLGQTVYFKILGNEYLNNYARGVVVGVAREQIVVAGKQNFVATMQSNSLLDRPSWKKKRDSLVKRDLINDPSGGLRKINVRGKDKLIVYEPQIAIAKKKTKTKRKDTEKQVRKIPRKSGPILLSHR